jgi:hypothetical protein
MFPKTNIALKGQWKYLVKFTALTGRHDFFDDRLPRALPWAKLPSPFQGKDIFRPYGTKKIHADNVFYQYHVATRPVLLANGTNTLHFALCTLNFALLTPNPEA